MDSHLNHQQMLAFLDGELSKAETNNVAKMTLPLS